MPIDPTDIAICLSNEDNVYGATSPPIVQTSLFTFPTLEELDTHIPLPAEKMPAG